MCESGREVTGASDPSSPLSRTLAERDEARDRPLVEDLERMAHHAEQTGDLCCLPRDMHSMIDCRDACVKALRDAVKELASAESSLRAVQQENEDLRRELGNLRLSTAGNPHSPTGKG
jgi:hypothetical protein